MGTDQVQTPRDEPGVDKPNADTLLKLRIPKLRKYVIAMLKEKYGFSEKSFDRILKNQGEEKITSLQSFGEMLYQCLLAYQEEYSGIFESHYTYTKITESAGEKMSSEDFEVLYKDILDLLRDQDAIGSLDRENGYFTALLVTDPYSREKLGEIQKSFQRDKGARVTLTVNDAS